MSRTTSQTLNALQAELTDLRAVLAAIDKVQAIIEFDLDGTIRTANENFLMTLGYRLEEIQGRHHSLFVEPAYAAGAEYRQFWADLAAGRYQAAEYKRLGKGGKNVWIQASYNPIFGPDGKPHKVVKFATDITAAKELDAELKIAVRGIVQNSQALATASEELTAVSQQMGATASETTAQANVVSAASEQVLSLIHI